MRSIIICSDMRAGELFVESQIMEPFAKNKSFHRSEYILRNGDTLVVQLIREDYYLLRGMKFDFLYLPQNYKIKPEDLGNTLILSPYRNPIRTYKEY